MEYFGWILITLFFGPPVIYVILRTLGDIRTESQSRKRVRETRRSEFVDGREYLVETRSLPIVKETRTGRMGLVLERGAENDPTTINGETVLQPRWIKVQFIRKSDGKFGRIEWRRYEKFETLGVTNVDFLARHGKIFQKEILIRHHVNFKSFR